MIINKTLTAIARDRRCQALMRLMRRGRDKILGTRRPSSDPEQFAAEHKASRENMFLDV